MPDLTRDTLGLVSEFLRLFGPYWGWCVVAAMLALVGEVLKRKAFTEALAVRSSFAKWWRATMPLHPVIVGALLGALPGMPLPDTLEGTTQAILYYAGAGVASTWAYDVVNTIRRWKGV